MTENDFGTELCKFLGLEDRRIIKLKIQIEVDKPIYIETVELLDMGKTSNPKKIKYKLQEITNQRK